MNTLGYITFVLFHTIPLILIFILPYYFIIKIEKGVFFILLLSCLIFSEYYFYTYFYASMDKTLGVYNILTSLIFMFIFFYEVIKLKFLKQGIKL
ncbi:hypothetical protein AD998_15190 [bacterium 336/3]|nr:hypothetical protein AD998_15190 [bacterium 336/3]